jgi:hypothetical protein
MDDLNRLQPLVADAFAAFGDLWDYVKNSEDSELKALVTAAHHTTRDAYTAALEEFEVDAGDLTPQARSGGTDKPPE